MQNRHGSVYCCKISQGNFDSFLPKGAFPIASFIPEPLLVSTHSIVFGEAYAYQGNLVLSGWNKAGSRV